MTQSIPFFILHQTAPHRVNLRNPAEVQPLILLNEELFLRHLPPHIENSHAVSRSFRQYWSSYKEVIFMDCKEILKTRFVFFADDGAEPSDASSSSMQGQSQVATSHGGQTPRGDVAAGQTEPRVTRRRAPLSTAEAAAKAELAAQKAAEKAEKAKKKLEEERMAQELQEKQVADRSARREEKKRARERDDQLLDEQRAKTIRSWPDSANPEVVQKTSQDVQAAETLASLHEAAQVDPVAVPSETLGYTPSPDAFGGDIDLEEVTSTRQRLAGLLGVEQISTPAVVADLDPPPLLQTTPPNSPDAPPSPPGLNDLKPKFEALKKCLRHELKDFVKHNEVYDELVAAFDDVLQAQFNPFFTPEELKILHDLKSWLSHRDALRQDRLLREKLSRESHELAKLCNDFKSKSQSNNQVLETIEALDVEANQVKAEIARLQARLEEIAKSRAEKIILVEDGLKTVDAMALEIKERKAKYAGGTADFQAAGSRLHEADKQWRNLVRAIDKFALP